MFCRITDHALPGILNSLHKAVYFSPDGKHKGQTRTSVLIFAILEQDFNAYLNERCLV